MQVRYYLQRYEMSLSRNITSLTLKYVLSMQHNAKVLVALDNKTD